MSLLVGIVGLPNVGKSTLFNALLKKRVALSANYPFATVEPNVGVVAVPDGRLAKLGELIKDEEHIEQLPPLVPAVVEFVDIAGLVKNAHKGAGLGNQFLSHIREVDTIVHVLRAFEDDNVPKVGSVDPKQDQQVVEIELVLADLGTIDKLIFDQEKKVKLNLDPLDKEKLAILEEIKKCLEEGKLAKDYSLQEERLKGWFWGLPLLTVKPVLYVLNVSEAGLTRKLQDDNTIVISAKVEEELADLSEEERGEYLIQLGMEESGLERLIKAAYEVLGLISFLTAGRKSSSVKTSAGPGEVRAWTIKKGTKAPQAAGVIHTDFEKNFIKSRVIEYERLIEAGSFSEAKKRGWIRSEGKDYEIREGEVVEFLVGS